MRFRQRCEKMYEIRYERRIDMKRLVALVMAVLMYVCGDVNCVVAQAAEEDITTWNISVKKDSELEILDAVEFVEEMQQVQIGGNAPELETNNSYTAYRYSETFSFYDGDVLLATADAVCIVWHYTDGKVHLYSRTITMTRYVSGIDVTKSYGSIVNTDGSLSYTSGDKVMISNGAQTLWFALDFYVTPNDADFSCYIV